MKNCKNCLINVNPSRWHLTVLKNIIFDWAKAKRKCLFMFNVTWVSERLLVSLSRYSRLGRSHRLFVLKCNYLCVSYEIGKYTGRTWIITNDRGSSPRSLQYAGPQASILFGIRRLLYILPSVPFITPSVNWIISGPHWVRKWPIRITLCWGVVIVWLPPQYRLHRWSLTFKHTFQMKFVRFLNWKFHDLV